MSAIGRKTLDHRKAMSLSKDLGLLAGAYLVLGIAGLLLTIPPGYATAVYPAAGVAVAMLLQVTRLPAFLGDVPISG